MALDEALSAGEVGMLKSEEVLPARSPESTVLLTKQRGLCDLCDFATCVKRS